MAFPNIITKFAGESFGDDILRTVYAGDDRSQVNQKEKNVLFIGPLGSDKSLLLDFLCNILYNVSYESPFRFNIANTKFDATTPQKKVTKYVFSGTRFPYKPQLIDTPDIGDEHGVQLSSELSGMISAFLNSDPSFELNCLCLVLPPDPNALSPQMLSEIQRSMGLFPRSMAENTVIIVSMKAEEQDRTYHFLSQLGLLSCRKFFVHTDTLFSLPPPPGVQRQLQQQYFISTVQNLTLFLMHVGQLTPKNMSIVLTRKMYPDKPPIQPRSRPASSVQPRVLTIPQTIVEVSESSLASTPGTPRSSFAASIQSAHVTPIKQHNSPPSIPTINLKKRPASFTEADDLQSVQTFRAKLLQQTYSSTSRLPTSSPYSRPVMYGSQPIGPEAVPVENHLFPFTLNKENGAEIQEKRFLYDPESRTYQLYFVKAKPPGSLSTSSTGSQTLPVANSPIPRVMSPLICQSPFNEPQQRSVYTSAEALNRTVTTDDSGSARNSQFNRGVESIRSTASEWKYTPSSGTKERQVEAVYRGNETTFGTTFAAVPGSVNTTYAEPMKLNAQGFFEAEQRKPPPKPARAVDPEFLETGEEQMQFMRTHQHRRTRRVNNSQRRAVKSHPAPKKLPEDGYGAEYDSDDMALEMRMLPRKPTKLNPALYSQRDLFMNPYPPAYETQPRIPPKQPFRRPVRGGPQRRRRRDVSFKDEPGQSTKCWDCNKCLFYVVAPVFILCAIIAVVLTLIFSNI